MTANDVFSHDGLPSSGGSDDNAFGQTLMQCEFYSPDQLCMCLSENISYDCIFYFFFCRDVSVGDIVTVGECRPLSKTVRFNVLKVTKAAGAKKQFQKF